jgi:hypothetical protein
MAVESFEDFCVSTCHLMSVEVPPLEPDESGMVGFHVTCRGANVAFMKGENDGEPALRMIVEFGPPPPEKELEILRGLMDANFLMGGMGAPAFVRNPSTGEVLLQHSLRLSQVDVQDVCCGIENAVDAVAKWKTTHFFDEPVSYGAMWSAHMSATGLA